MEVGYRAKLVSQLMALEKSSLLDQLSHRTKPEGQVRESFDETPSLPFDNMNRETEQYAMMSSTSTESFSADDEAGRNTSAPLNQQPKVHSQSDITVVASGGKGNIAERWMSQIASRESYEKENFKRIQANKMREVRAAREPLDNELFDKEACIDPPEQQKQDLNVRRRQRTRKRLAVSDIRRSSSRSASQEEVIATDKNTKEERNVAGRILSQRTKRGTTPTQMETEESVSNMTKQSTHSNLVSKNEVVTGVFTDMLRKSVENSYPGMQPRRSADFPANDGTTVVTAYTDTVRSADDLLNGRSTGLIFCTETGKSLDEFSNIEFSKIGIVSDAETSTMSISSNMRPMREETSIAFPDTVLRRSAEVFNGDSASMASHGDISTNSHGESSMVSQADASTASHDQTFTSYDTTSQVSHDESLGSNAYVQDETETITTGTETSSFMDMSRQSNTLLYNEETTIMPPGSQQSSSLPPYDGETTTQRPSSRLNLSDDMERIKTEYFALLEEKRQRLEAEKYHRSSVDPSKIPVWSSGMQEEPGSMTFYLSNQEDVADVDEWKAKQTPIKCQTEAQPPQSIPTRPLSWHGGQIPVHKPDVTRSPLYKVKNGKEFEKQKYVYRSEIDELKRNRLRQNEKDQEIKSQSRNEYEITQTMSETIGSNMHSSILPETLGRNIHNTIPPDAHLLSGSEFEKQKYMHRSEIDELKKNRLRQNEKGQEIKRQSRNEYEIIQSMSETIGSSVHSSILPETLGRNIHTAILPNAHSLSGSSALSESFEEPKPSTTKKLIYDKKTHVSSSSSLSDQDTPVESAQNQYELLLRARKPHAPPTPIVLPESQRHKYPGLDLPSERRPFKGRKPGRSIMSYPMANYSTLSDELATELQIKKKEPEFRYQQDDTVHKLYIPKNPYDAPEYHGKAMPIPDERELTEKLENLWNGRKVEEEIPRQPVKLDNSTTKWPSEVRAEENREHRVNGSKVMETLNDTTANQLFTWSNVGDSRDPPKVKRRVTIHSTDADMREIRSEKRYSDGSFIPLYSHSTIEYKEIKREPPSYNSVIVTKSLEATKHKPPPASPALPPNVDYVTPYVTSTTHMEERPPSHMLQSEYKTIDVHPRGINDGQRTPSFPPKSTTYEYNVDDTIDLKPYHPSSFRRRMNSAGSHHTTSTGLPTYDTMSVSSRVSSSAPDWSALPRRQYSTPVHTVENKGEVVVTTKKYQSETASQNSITLPKKKEGGRITSEVTLHMRRNINSPTPRQGSSNTLNETVIKSPHTYEISKKQFFLGGGKDGQMSEPPFFHEGRVDGTASTTSAKSTTTPAAASIEAVAPTLAFPEAEGCTDTIDEVFLAPADTILDTPGKIYLTSNILNDIFPCKSTLESDSDSDELERQLMGSIQDGDEWNDDSFSSDSTIVEEHPVVEEDLKDRKISQTDSGVGALGSDEDKHEAVSSEDSIKLYSEDEPITAVEKLDKVESTNIRMKEDRIEERISILQEQTNTHEAIEQVEQPGSEETDIFCMGNMLNEAEEKKEPLMELLQDEEEWEVDGISDTVTIEVIHEPYQFLNLAAEVIMEEAEDFHSSNDNVSSATLEDEEPLNDRTILIDKEPSEYISEELDENIREQSTEGLEGNVAPTDIVSNQKHENEGMQRLVRFESESVATTHQAIEDSETESTQDISLPLQVPLSLQHRNLHKTFDNLDILDEKELHNIVSYHMLMKQEGMEIETETESEMDSLDWSESMSFQSAVSADEEMMRVYKEHVQDVREKAGLEEDAVSDDEDDESVLIVAGHDVEAYKKSSGCGM